ncbi:hypothetical protein [Plantactinospora sp. KBS50]|nr:hypothetical protein [Plantactinospora sp. KBS50]
MKFYQVVALIWIVAGVVTSLTWMILRHRRSQARTALRGSRGELPRSRD